jgi:hypothetical protein
VLIQTSLHHSDLEKILLVHDICLFRADKKDYCCGVSERRSPSGASFHHKQERSPRLGNVHRAVTAMCTSSLRPGGMHRGHAGALPSTQKQPFVPICGTLLLKISH